MKFSVLATSGFKKDFKKLVKKYKSLKGETTALIISLETDPFQGTPLGKDCFKIRLAIQSKGKGKSGGARVITCIKVLQNTVYLLSIYDKSVQSTMSDKELSALLKQTGA